jgi:hypothetical protein
VKHVPVFEQPVGEVAIRILARQALRPTQGKALR